MKNNNINILGRITPSNKKIHQNQEVLSPTGIIISLKATHYKDPPKVLIRRTDGKKI